MAHRLLRSADGATRDALARYAKLPEWSDALRAVDVAIAQRREERPRAFLVKRDNVGIRVVAGSLREGAFAPEPSFPGEDPIGREDLRVARALNRPRSQQSMEDVLTALVGHPRVFAGPAMVSPSARQARLRAVSLEPLRMKVFIDATPRSGNAGHSGVTSYSETWAQFS